MVSLESLGSLACLHAGPCQRWHEHHTLKSYLRFFLCDGLEVVRHADRSCLGSEGAPKTV